MISYKEFLAQDGEKIARKIVKLPKLIKLKIFIT